MQINIFFVYLFLILKLFIIFVREQIYPFATIYFETVSHSRLVLLRYLRLILRLAGSEGGLFYTHPNSNKYSFLEGPQRPGSAPIADAIGA